MDELETFVNKVRKETPGFDKQELQDGVIYIIKPEWVFKSR